MSDAALIEYMAERMWETRQAGYRMVQLRRPKAPLLKDWKDCPEDTKQWMRAEARAAKQAIDSFERSLAHEVSA